MKNEQRGANSHHAKYWILSSSEIDDADSVRDDEISQWKSARVRGTKSSTIIAGVQITRPGLGGGPKTFTFTSMNGPHQVGGGDINPQIAMGVFHL